MATKTIGQNVTITQDKGRLTIEIDTTKEFGPSKSGKTIRIASTEGNVKLEDGVVLGLNCYRPRG